MLRLVLVENLCRLAGGTVEIRNLRMLAKAWVERLRQSDSTPDQLAQELVETAGHLLVSVLQGLRTDGVTRERLEQFEEAARERGVHVEDLLLGERQRQAANQVTVGNGVTSLRLLSSIEWPVFYEKASLVDARLRSDPAGVYAGQEFATRDRYRQAIEVLARDRGINELDVCDRLLERARQAQSSTHVLGADAPPASHVGHYLIGEGRPEFAREIGAAKRPAIGRCSGPCPTLPAGTLAPSRPFGFSFSFRRSHMPPRSAPAGRCFCSSFWRSPCPAAEIAIGAVNYSVTKIVPPQTLPKMDFSRGIPDDCCTFVVMPTLLSSSDGTASLLERLEIHYLSNPDSNLRFALLTDWSDAPEEHAPNDDALVRQVVDGIKRLNQIHAREGFPRFFVFHRRRVWNPVQNCWMGWERKRGKLAEFNRLLLGRSETTYSVLSCPATEIPKVRFVITVDSDTQLPRESARRMVGTLAHPLNRPRLDRTQKRSRGRVCRLAAARERFSAGGATITVLADAGGLRRNRSLHLGDFRCLSRPVQYRHVYGQRDLRRPSVRGSDRAGVPGKSHSQP